MNVVWYYSIKGERTGPISWNELKSAVHTGILSGDDLIWSTSMGKEWQKASTFTSLFPPLKSETPSPIPEESTIEVTGPESLKIKISFKPEVSPFIRGREEEDLSKPLAIKCIESLKRAWLNTTILLFSAFSIKRWFTLAICIMLTSLATTNPFSMLFVKNDDGTSAQQIEKLGLTDVAESRLFHYQLPKELIQQDPENPVEIDSSAIMTDLGDAMRDTAHAVYAWGVAPEHRLHLGFALICILLIYALHIWFSARGQTMLLIRIYRPSAPMIATWIESDKPAAVLFRGLFAVKVISFVAWVSILIWGIYALTNIPVAQVVPSIVVKQLFFSLLGVFILENIATHAIVQFAAPHIILSGSKFISSCKTALSYTGFWFVRYLCVLVCVYLTLAILSSILGLLLGMGMQAQIIILFSSPLIGSLLTLPLHLLQRLWTLDLIFRANPKLRAAVPSAKFMKPPM